MKTTTNEATVNVVRFSKGSEFVRFEIARGSEWGTMHNSRNERATMHIDEIRERMMLLSTPEWTVAAV